MPLRKLWNAITGRSDAPAAATSPDNSPGDGSSHENASKGAEPQAGAQKAAPRGAATQPNPAATGPKSSTPRGAAPALKVAANTMDGPPAKPAQRRVPTDKVGSRKKSAGKRQKAIASHANADSQPVVAPEPALAATAKPPRAKVSRRDPLIKALSGDELRSPATVLEIGVGDGSRAIKVCTVLEESLETVRYVAIDQFEMGGGETKLMDFHRSLRAVGIRPQVFPEPLESGLTRVAHTIGACDLVLISDQLTEANLDAIEPQLARIAHPDTRVLLQRGKNWIIHTLSRADLRRAA